MIYTNARSGVKNNNNLDDKQFNVILKGHHGMKLQLKKNKKKKKNTQTQKVLDKALQ